MAESALNFTITDWNTFREAEGPLKRGQITFAPGAFCKIDAMPEGRMVRISGYKHDFDAGANILLEVDVDKAYLCDVLEAAQANVILEIEGGTRIATAFEVRVRSSGYETSVNGGKPKKWVRDPEMAFKIQKTQYRSRSPYALIECYLAGFDNVLDNAFAAQGWLAS